MATSGARRDQILEDLLAKDNFSQALKHLNKKLKKQPKSTDNLVTKIFVLQRTGDIQGAIEICEALVNSKPPITDLNQLFQIHQNLANLERIDKVTSCAKLAVTLWKNSINVQRNASERVLIAKKWAQNAITFSQWAQVQQAARSIQVDLPDTHPDKRTYFFWEIVAYYLSSRTDPGSQSAGIQSAIACRMADQSVKDMPEIIDAVLKTPGKHVSSRSELELFMLTSGKSQPGKAIDLLEQKSLGPSKVPTNDKWGALGLNRLLLSESERRVELRKMSRETLDNAQKTRNEWKQQDLALWKDTIVKGSGTDEELARGEAIDFAANAVKADAGARPASLVLMELLHDQFSQKEVFEESSDYSTFKLAFQAHVKALITSPVFESDLLALLEEWRKRGFQPPAEIRNIIRDEAEQVSAGAKASSPTEQLKWITAEANSLSCDLQHYEIQWKQDSSVWPTVGDSSESTSHLQIPLRHKPKQLPAEISTFVASCIKLYKVARAHTAKLPKFDPDPGDKALLLAARALSWAGEISRHQNFRILGTCLLQFLVEESEYNSKARMMLISRLQALGLHSLAAETYSNLRVKGVLFESCAPLFFTRISVYHPKPTRNFKPYEETTKALKFYADSLTATGNFQGASLDEKNYGSVIKMQELRDQLQNSATRQLLCLERRRISRMTGTPLKDEGLLFGTFAPNRSRDSKGFQNTQTVNKPMDVPPNCGLPANTQTLIYLEYVQRTLEFIRNGPGQPIQPLGWIEDMAASTQDNTYQCSLTSTELFWTYAGVRMAYLARTFYSSTVTLSSLSLQLTNLRNSLDVEFVGNPQSIIKEWPSYEADGRGYFPTWELFESLYSCFDMLKGLISLTGKIEAGLKDKFKKEPSTLRQEVQEKTKSMQTLAKTLHHDCRNVMKGIREKLSRMSDAPRDTMLETIAAPALSADNEIMRNALKLHQAAFDLMGPDRAARIFRSFLQSGIDACDSYLSLPEDLLKAQ